MTSDELSRDVVIHNRMGFHVRPVQRFATMARMFRCDVQVHLRSRTVPGKSVINLVSLGGRHGETLNIAVSGEDAEQCLNVLFYLAEHDFFVEDNSSVRDQLDRHILRLRDFASFFRSRITVSINGQSADAKDAAGLRALGLTPTSTPTIDVEGEDAEQARALIQNLVDSCFYVEDEMAKRSMRAD